MDDSCAVCADSLEWEAYGACGHREVCSTCVARLRFICEDRRCCICKTECNVVFVTKALGDYTRMINDFSVLPSELREGKVGPHWYHEDTQAFFDDGDHYKMIKAMCRLSCSVCDKMDEQPNDGSRRQGKFRNIKQLKGHLFHRHKLLMCSLCLEGRKVFIGEQKLYTRAQLNQHISTGDSEVDGSESERGGFNGHPRCEFCRTPFYGDNELYLHMSTEHYTCHICQRQHPGQYEYYKNYDDLEIHFCRDHYLCEDEACLGKKFIVFQSEAELKRHNTIEHGGRMSRAKRNAVLQIPTSFRYRRSNEDNRRGRGQTFRPELADYQLYMAIEASLVRTAGEPPSSSSGLVVSDHGDPNSIDPIVQPFEALSTTDSEPPSRYLQAVAQGLRGVPLEETSFPPLSMASSTSQQSAKSNSEALPSNTMAAHLRRQRNVHVLNSAQARPVASHRSVQLSSSPVQFRPTMPATSHGASTGAAVLSDASSALGKAQSTTVNGLISSGSSSASSGNAGRISHSASTPSLADGQPLIPSASDFPPVSTTQMQKMPSSSHAPTNVEDVHTANKSLVEKIRAALEYDEDKYTAFKDISGQYRQGLIDTGKYLNYVQQYELSHLLLELARLCPDAQKQRELIETYNASMRSNALQARIGGHGNLRLKDDNSSRKGKGKSLVTKDGHSKDTLADSVISTVRELQSNNNPTEEEVEVLSKDGYRGTEGKLKVMANEQLVELSSQNHPAIKIGSKNDSVSTGGGSGVGGGGGGGKQRKKTSKFQRLRLGDGSMEAILDPKNSEPEQPDHMLDGNQNPAGGLPVRGVWRTGGGQKLFP